MSSIDINNIDTERRNDSTNNIDIMNSIEFVKVMNREDKKIAFAVEEAIGDIALAIDLAANTLENFGRIVYLGAGNSGRIAAGDALECVPTFGVSKNTVIYVLAGGKKALIESNEGEEDNSIKAIEDLIEVKLEKKDLVIGLSASGRTPYVFSGLEYARELGCRTISISCSKNSKISKKCNCNINLLVGPEVITGSTRLKAGTAQKMVVNMISTGSMIKLGKVYKNYMVDVSVKNEKLYERGKKIIKECTGVSDEMAGEYLNNSKGSVKLAIIMILKGTSFEESKKLIEVEPSIRKLI